MKPSSKAMEDMAASSVQGSVGALSRKWFINLKLAFRGSFVVRFPEPLLLCWKGGNGIVFAHQPLRRHAVLGR